MDVSRRCSVVLEDIVEAGLMETGSWRDFLMEEDVESQLTKEIPCRKSEIRSLCSLLGKRRGNKLPRSLFVYGHSGTGKSYVLGKVLAALGHRSAVVDCVQCYLPRLLYLSILTKLSGLDADEFRSSCDNVLDFMVALKNLATDDGLVIVLDRCERMRSVSRTVLPMLARLGELAGVNVCVVMVSCVVPEKFYSPKGYFETVAVHFRQYGKDEAYEILSCEREGDDLYRSYLGLFLNVFYSSCRNLHELKYMVNSNFERHLQSSSSATGEMRQLWKTAGPQLGASLGELYTRTSFTGGDVELPYLSKYLLVSAYLASYVPSKMDRALFVKLSGRNKKRVQRSHSDVLGDVLLGPKPFTADRLVAIFYSVVGDRHVSFTVNLSVQISSLVKLRLLTAINSCLDCPKFKCAVGLDFVKTVARSVGFDVVRFLFPK